MNFGLHNVRSYARVMMCKGSTGVWNFTEKSMPRQDTKLHPAPLFLVYLLINIWSPIPQFPHRFWKVKRPLAALTSAAQDRTGGGDVTSPPPVNLQCVFSSDAYPRHAQQVTTLSFVQVSESLGYWETSPRWGGESIIIYYVWKQGVYRCRMFCL